MPCDSSYMEPTEREQESLRIRKFLRETGHSVPLADCYGDVKNLDRDTRRLCAWCKKYPIMISRKSLELQIWWRDHQKHDKAKEAAEETRKKNIALRKTAMKKLSKEEKRALGLQYDPKD